MRRIGLILVFCICTCGLIVGPEARACTNIMVTKGASQDGSVMVTYSCDGEWHPILRITPAADHEPGDSLEISDWSGNVRGKIKQV